MVVLSTFAKRGLLRSFKSQVAQGKTLSDVLLSILSAPSLTVQKGKILVGSNAGSVSASYSINIGLNQAEVLDVVSELMDRYDQAKAELVAAGTINPTDDQIYTQELADLRAIKGYTANWMYLSK